jgi:hypothetical protein
MMFDHGGSRSSCLLLLLLLPLPNALHFQTPLLALTTNRKKRYSIFQLILGKVRSVDILICVPGTTDLQPWAQCWFQSKVP